MKQFVAPQCKQTCIKALGGGVIKIIMGGSQKFRVGMVITISDMVCNNLRDAPAMSTALTRNGNAGILPIGSVLGRKELHDLGCHTPTNQFGQHGCSGILKQHAMLVQLLYKTTTL